MAHRDGPAVLLVAGELALHLAHGGGVVCPVVSAVRIAHFSGRVVLERPLTRLEERPETHERVDRDGLIALPAADRLLIRLLEARSGSDTSRPYLMSQARPVRQNTHRENIKRAWEREGVRPGDKALKLSIRAAPVLRTWQYRNTSSQ